LAAARDGRISARLSRRGAGDPRRRNASRFQPQRHFHGYRKLHENVASFKNFLDKTAAQFGAVTGIQSHDDARETVMAKMAGRWSDGVPLSLAPTADEWRKFNDTYKAVDPAVDQRARRPRGSSLELLIS